ncbi:hypothetical protein E1293_22755 [Actinomadura darangshiensis]|uniref:Uncharacterized protein n=1 Tax=Actinomadura darangshiensis TaxID=705336 RepID=A0A4V2YUZ5_9ACTN|nr:hypothetical protein [Actinomadura darangshiensis]TDD79637.1 hypothetical protein E1293_22755 [Actinomadura darangshiensis]
MKIRCACGNLVRDQTDFIPYKARVIADQDWSDALDALDADQLWSLSRTMWQCTECGRLFIEDHDDRLRVFAPDSPAAPSDLLRSVHRDAWKRPLVGHWRTWTSASDGPPGELWWGIGVADEGMEDFDRWEDLERRYYEVFERLRGGGLLRSAFLRRGGDMVHEWPSP